MQKNQLRTPLSVVRGFGSAKEGTGHFFMQRMTAIVLIPLSLWLVYSLLNTAIGADSVKLSHWLSPGLNAAALIILLLALFYHAKLGVQTIIEDYVHCPCIKMASLLANYFVMFTFAIISVLAVLKLHLHLLP